MPIAHVNGIDIAYEIHGSGTPLVLAHGYTASKEMWRAQIGPFSERYRVIVYDTRGHGASTAPPADDPGYTFDTYVEDQRALLAHLGIDAAYIGGLSMGGGIAMRFALRYPQMTKALLLTDTAARDTSDQSPVNLRELWRSQHAMIETVVRSQGVAALMRFLYGQATLAPGDPPDAAFEPPGLSPDGFLGAGEALFRQDDVLDRLPEITAPTLILVGEHDWLLGPSKEMHQRLPDARFVLIKGAGHGTCVWRPEAYTAAVLDFLTDVDAGRPVAGTEER